jgi:hypothetical protein
MKSALIFGACMSVLLVLSGAQSAIGQDHLLANQLQPEVSEVPLRRFKTRVRSVPNIRVVDLARLSMFIEDCVKKRYELKKLNAGYYISDPQPDDTFDFPGVRMRVIVPSELFRDSFVEWDGFEVVAALEVPSADAAFGKLWMLAMNYSYRGRGGVSFGPIPSPSWQYNALSDLDSTNGRLRKIQTGINAQIRASVNPL